MASAAARIGTTAARTAVAALFVALGGCASVPATAPDGAPAPAAVAQPEGFRLNYPIRLADRPTTSADVYLGNLDAAIEDLDRKLAAAPGARVESTLAGKLYHRYRVAGRIADGERALALLDAALARDGDAELAHVAAESHLLRAIVRQAFHRFADAEADLAKARALGAPAARVATVQRDVDLALGRYDRLAGEFARAREPTPDHEEAAWRAHLLLLKGDADGAAWQYYRAQGVYADSSPVPLAWLHTQQGIALLDAGDCAGAVPFFEAALERVPTYYLAMEHLAECAATLGDLDRARTLYRQVIVQTGNPEFVGALADVETKAGNVDAAKRLVTKARATWEVLLGRHREAWVQHAAEFHLAHGKPRRTLRLATENIALRQDVGSRVLLAQAYANAGFFAEACAERAKAIATGLKPAGLRELDWLAERCM